MFGTPKRASAPTNLQGLSDFMKLDRDSTLGKLTQSWVPTLVLCYAFSATTLKAYRYHETFGAGNYYLDVYYDVNPRGYFQKGRLEQKIRFNGFFIKGKNEASISGYFTRTAGHQIYQFDSSEGRFDGKLEARSSGSGCEPTLNFQWQPQGEALETGSLPAGFCIN